MKRRIFFTLLLFLGVAAAIFIHDAGRGAVEGNIAVQQLADDDATYIAANRVVRGNFIPTLIVWCTIVCFCLLWVGPIVKCLKGVCMNKRCFMLLLLCAIMIGCKPYMGEKFVDIKPNESAFVVPLEGASKANQGKFDSVEFLEERKVATKRIAISRRYKSVGRMWWAAEIVDTVRVITVDRSPVSREWTSERATGTSPNDDLIYVESKDSIGFGIGCTITAAIEESNSATYLYNFPQGRPLEKVLDSDIRASVTKVLAREFGARDLAQCKTDKAAIFDIAFKETGEYWRTFGVTIRMLGHSGGLAYENPKIQDAIDRNYEAEMEIERNENLKRAQEHENARLLSIEVTNRERAEEFNRALEAQTAKIRLEIDRMEAEARLEMAKKWNGQLPTSILPQGSNLLMGLDSAATK